MNKTTQPSSAADTELDSFDGSCRRRALAHLAPQSADSQTLRPRVNMHLHSFFSFNTLGYSPSHLAWEARRAGLYAAGLCDFDVLDGLEEFLQAGLILGLRSAVNLETRAFVQEYADMDINSPGEHGVTYIMGAGFPRIPAAGSPAAATLANLRRQADERNQALAQRINARLPEIALDYARDVTPLSPSGCPTERHLVRAYRLKAESKFTSREQLLAFWTKVTNRPAAALAKLAGQVPAMEDAIRSALAKRGGIGYAPPTAKTFPAVDDFIAWVLSCEAIPMITWLDGTSAGEKDMRAMFECLQAKGACALNIIPDRNHNIADAATRAIKLQKLDDVVLTAEELGMPINIGTEMNKEGQPFVDDTECEALRPYHEAFLRGARIMVGQSLLARYAGFSYTGAAARAEFGPDIKHKNRLFESVGSLPPLTKPLADRLETMGRDKALACLRDSAVRGQLILSD
jgi:hypothetical protein